MPTNDESNTPASTRTINQNEPNQKQFLNRPAVQNVLPFIIGGGSGMVATTCIQPIDVVKVRIQLLGEGSKSAARDYSSPFVVARRIIAEGSILDLYAGLSAGYLRQATYATLRLGFFDRFLAALESRASDRGSRRIGFRERATASLSAGGLAAAISNPVEVALIRMQSDGMKSRDQRANYRSVFDALVRVARREGVRGLWNGSSPTVVRAMSTNFGQLAFFSESKSQLARRTDMSMRSQTVVASAIAGFFASLFSLPFDFLKTRLQRGNQSGSGVPQYKGMLDCAVQVVKNEGPLRFYRGFGTYFLRIAPHSIITLIVADNVTAYIKG